MHPAYSESDWRIMVWIIFFMFSSNLIIYSVEKLGPEIPQVSNLLRT